MIDGSSVDSIEISSDKGMRIRISKNSNQRATVQVGFSDAHAAGGCTGWCTGEPLSDKATPAEIAARTEKPKAKYLE